MTDVSSYVAIQVTRPADGKGGGLRLETADMNVWYNSHVVIGGRNFSPFEMKKPTIRIDDMLKQPDSLFFILPDSARDTIMYDGNEAITEEALRERTLLRLLDGNWSQVVHTVLPGLVLSGELEIPIHPEKRFIAILPPMENPPVPEERLIRLEEPFGSEGMIISVEENRSSRSPIPYSIACSFEKMPGWAVREAGIRIASSLYISLTRALEVLICDRSLKTALNVDLNASSELPLRYLNSQGELVEDLRVLLGRPLTADEKDLVSYAYDNMDTDRYPLAVEWEKAINNVLPDVPLPANIDEAVEDLKPGSPLMLRYSAFLSEVLDASTIWNLYETTGRGSIQDFSRLMPVPDEMKAWRAGTPISELFPEVAEEDMFVPEALAGTFPSKKLDSMLIYRYCGEATSPSMWKCPCWPPSSPYPPV